MDIVVALIGGAAVIIAAAFIIKVKVVTDGPITVVLKPDSDIDGIHADLGIKRTFNTTPQEGASKSAGISDDIFLSDSYVSSVLQEIQWTERKGDEIEVTMKGKS